MFVRLEFFILKYASSRPKSWALIVVSFGLVLSLFSKFPAYTDAHAKYPGSFAAFPATPYGQAIQWWLEHPLRPVPVAAFFPVETREVPGVAGMMSHCEKLTFRIFLPLLNQVVGGKIWTLVGANYLATLSSFFFIYQLCRRVTGDVLLATFSTWAYAVCWAGSWGFNDLIFGDAVAVALLLAAMTAQRSWLVAGLVAAACSTDERALATTPLLILFRDWQRESPFADTRAKFNFPALWQSAAPFLCGVAGYSVARLLATWFLHVPTGTSMMATVDIFLYHFYVSYPVKIFGVFEFLWVVPVLFLYDLSTKGSARGFSPMAYAIGLAGSALPALLVWDVDRSLCYLLPGVVAALCFGARATASDRRRVPLCFFASFLWLVPNESWLRYLVF